jgi:hypothetical protein
MWKANHKNTIVPVMNTNTGTYNWYFCSCLFDLKVG